jgi:hypothetical protein
VAALYSGPPHGARSHSLTLGARAKLDALGAELREYDEEVTPTAASTVTFPDTKDVIRMQSFKPTGEGRVP